MIERDLTDGILTLRLAHGKASAMDVELLAALSAELDAAAAARAVVLTGTGSIFSAGVDLLRLTDGGEEYVRRFFPLLTDLIRRLFTFPAPMVVAANGHAIAGGGLMVMCGDFRLMAEGSGRIGVPELLVGVPFPAAPLEVVRWAVRPDLVQQLVYTGRAFAPHEALAHGLVDEVVSPEALVDRAREMAAQLAALPGEVFRLTKQRLRGEAAERMTRDPAYDERALALWSAPETHDRIRAYLAKTVRR
ncbi:MAG TPA: enoyl-CoA hydratase-related protein [Longimicrobium sp.]|jgi:enoyl-CoA hydratase|nr:enoyl-CoA hydratase-related protein [Longimicrobium sp.]